MSIEPGVDVVFVLLCILGLAAFGSPPAAGASKVSKNDALALSSYDPQTAAPA